METQIGIMDYPAEGGRNFELFSRPTASLQSQNFVLKIKRMKTCIILPLFIF